MLVRTIRKVKHRANTALQEWLSSQHHSSEELLVVFSEVLQLYCDTSDPTQSHDRTVACLDRAGGVAPLLEACETRLQHRLHDWRAFLTEPYRSQRALLLNILAVLPLRAVNEKESVLTAVRVILGLRSERDPWVTLKIDDQFLGRHWRPSVCHPTETGVYCRRTLECAVLFELVAGLRSGELHVEGAAHFGNYRTELFAGAVDQREVSLAFRECGLPETAPALVEELKSSLRRASHGLDLAINQYECIKLNDQGLPIVTRPPKQSIPPSLEALTRLLDKRLPERGILEALYNTDRWTSWTRHFGPPSRIATQMDDPAMRYVLTTFAYGCGLGPTQASQHLDKPIPEHVLRFINRRHVSVDDLRAACTDLINLYARFDLPSCWGPSQAASADGSLVETYADNLFATYHVRYRRTGGIAYRHVADNYVALFSQFVVCGVHEAVYILDGILQNRSEVRPSRLHADSHGQSEAVFGLAYLLGIELMPRIRNWRSLRLYSADNKPELRATFGLYSGAIDWDVIASNWEVYGRLVLAIRSGRLTASVILARLNSYSRRNSLYRALQELGRVVRTIYLLGWINDEELRGQVTQATNKVESFHAFSAHLNFGSAGVSTTNNPAEQEKRVVYNQLVCNAVMLQNVADQTQALNSLHEEGNAYDRNDLGFLSPYGTSHLKRFGEYRAEHQAEMQPDTHMRVKFDESC